MISFSDVFGKVRDALHTGVGAVANGAKNGVRGLVSSGFGFKKPVAKVSAVVGKTADYLHISKRATAGVLVTSLLLGGAGAGLSVMSNGRQDFIARQEYYEEPCIEEKDDTVSGTTLDVDIDAMQMETANKIWGLCKALGQTDECAASLLGNMQCESGIDPTGLEGIYTEHYNIDGPRKKVARTDLCAYTRTMFDTTYRNWAKIDKKTGNHWYRTSRGCYYREKTSGSGGTLSIGTYGSCDGHFGPGLGLVQNTGGRCAKLLSYANSANNYNWWDLELQCAFHIDTTGGDGRDRVAYMWGEDYPYRSRGNAGWSRTISDTQTTKNITDLWTACQFCELDMIGHKPKPMAENKRYKCAQKWYEIFKGTKGDQNFAKSVLALANTIQGGALAFEVAKQEESCEEAEPEYNNGDLARAAVAYAYKTAHVDRGSDYSWGGTALYQFLHDNVFGAKSKGWYKYKSCDISVATAVRWSDADDSYPHGNTSVQDPYMTKEAKWEFIGKFDQMSIDDLQPGDILITTRSRRIKFKGMGHIVMYVSNEIVKEKYPDSDGNFVSGSWGSRAPNVQTSTTGSAFKGDAYWVYRLKSDLADYGSNKYSGIAEGKRLENSENGYIEYKTGK